jgi:hypothetical protein
MRPDRCRGERIAPELGVVGDALEVKARCALRYFCLDGTDHESHQAQALRIRRYMAWRNHNAQDKARRELVRHVARHGARS